MKIQNLILLGLAGTSLLSQIAFCEVKTSEINTAVVLGDEQSGTKLPACEGAIKVKAIYDGDLYFNQPSEFEVTLSNLKQCSLVDVVQDGVSRPLASDAKDWYANSSTYVLRASRYNLSKAIKIVVHSETRYHQDTVSLIKPAVITRNDKVKTALISSNQTDSFTLVYFGQIAKDLKYPTQKLVAHIQLNHNGSGFINVPLTPSYSGASYSTTINKIDSEHPEYFGLFQYAVDGKNANNWDFEVYFQDGKRYDSNRNYQTGEAPNYKVTLPASKR